MNEWQRMRQTGHTARMKDTEHIYKIAFGINNGQTPLELRRIIKVDNINL